MFKGLSVRWLKGVNQHRQVECGRRGRLPYLTIALLFSVTLTLSVSPAQISITRWINPTGGDWHNSNNWDNSVPDANKQAVIDLPDTYTVHINSPTTAAGLVLGNDDPSDTGTKTLIVSSTLTLNWQQCHQAEKYHGFDGNIDGFWEGAGGRIDGVAKVWDDEGTRRDSGRFKRANEGGK